MFPSQEAFGFEEGEDGQSGAREALQEAVIRYITVTGGEIEVSAGGIRIEAVIERGEHPVFRCVEQFFVAGEPGHLAEQEGEAGGAVAEAGVVHAVGLGVHPDGGAAQDPHGLILPLFALAVGPYLPEGRPDAGIAVAPGQPAGLVGFPVDHPVREEGAVGVPVAGAGEEVVHPLFDGAEQFAAFADRPAPFVERLAALADVVSAQDHQDGGEPVGESEVDLGQAGLGVPRRPGGLSRRRGYGQRREVMRERAGGGMVRERHVHAQGAVEQVVIALFEARVGELPQEGINAVERGAFGCADVALLRQVVQGVPDAGKPGGIGRPVIPLLDHRERTPESEKTEVFMPVGGKKTAVLVQKNGLAGQSGEKTGVHFLLNPICNCLCDSV